MKFDVKYIDFHPVLGEFEFSSKPESIIHLNYISKLERVIYGINY